MKRILQLLLILSLFTIPSVAQEKDPWVGDWTSESYSDIDWEASNATKDANGTIQQVIRTDYRLIFRITKNGDQYMIRAKTTKVDDPSYIKYRIPIVFKRIVGNTMYLESYIKNEPFRVNGEIDEYSDLTYYYTLTLDNNVIHYNYYKCHSVNYDTKMRYIGEEDIFPSSRGDKLNLFNDNW